MSAEDRVAYWKRRCAIAEGEVAWERGQQESLRRWMTNCFDEERRLRDRCTHLFGMLRAHGLTDEQIDGPLPEGTKYTLTLVDVNESVASGRLVDE